MADQYPENLEGAIRILVSLVPEEVQTSIATMTEDQLYQLHLSLGKSIRNDFGLWEKNSPLMRHLGHHSPDDASMDIIHAFWKHLNEVKPKIH